MSEDEASITKDRGVRINKINNYRCEYKLDWELKEIFYCTECSFNNTKNECISSLLAVLNNKDFEKKYKEFLS